MNKYWMVYRPQPKQQLGEDLSSRQPDAELVVEPAAPAISRTRLFLLALSRQVRRLRAGGQRKRLSEA
ncbi:MAG: hypothetical protein KDE56_30800 [Anaerolineales bacterium]|nr:hypothetical protein [Anaerolineales bacterium]